MPAEVHSGAPVRIYAIGDGAKNIVQNLPSSCCQGEVLLVASLAQAQSIDFAGTGLAIIVAALGGETGTRGAMLLAERARAAGQFAIAVVSRPASLNDFTGEALRVLRANCAGLVEFTNDLLESEVSSRQVFSVLEALNGRMASLINRIAGREDLTAANCQGQLDAMQ